MVNLKLVFRILSLFVPLLFLTKNSSGQIYDKIFRFQLEAAHLEFKMPKGFTELDSTTSVTCGNAYFIVGTVMYSLVNKDSSIVIAFNNLMAKNTTRYDPMENVLNNLKHKPDTLNHTTILHNKEYSNKIFNADISAEYTLNCPKPFMGKYRQNRSVIMAKADIGEASIIYYYKDKRKDEIDDIILKTAEMLKFKKIKL